MSTVRRQHLRPAFLLFLCGLVVALWAPTALATEPFSPATPEDTGLTSEGLDQLASIVSDYLDEDQIVGAELMVIKNRRTVLHRDVTPSTRSGASLGIRTLEGINGKAETAYRRTDHCQAA